jgi:hypothetical protein
MVNPVVSRPRQVLMVRLQPKGVQVRMGTQLDSDLSIWVGVLTIILMAVLTDTYG